MASGRDDFVIAIRSAFLKKKDKQKFSLLTLIFLSVFVIILSNINFKGIKIIKSSINEVIFRSSFFISIPENYIKEIKQKFDEHMEMYDDYKKTKIEIEILKQKKIDNDYLKIENEKLRTLIDEKITSNQILAKVLIDKNSPFLKSIIINRGSSSGIAKGMPVLDGNYLVGRIVEVNYLSSRVLLLNDLNSRIPVTFGEKSNQAILTGKGGRDPAMEYLPETYEAEPNISVFTSGKDGVLIPGLPIGKTIVEEKSINVKLFSDPNQLSFVTVQLTDITKENF